MDNTVHDEDLLIRYLDGELNADEKTSVQSRLKTDVAFRERYQNLLVAIQAVRQMGTAQQVTKIHQEMMTELEVNKPSGGVFKLTKVIRYSMAVAASVLVLFIGVRLYLNAQPSPDKIYNESFVDFNVANTRSTDDNLSSIETLYQQKRFEDVVASGHTIHLSAKDSLLIGLSYLHKNNLSSAINWFRTLANTENEYRQDAEFYLSLAYVKAKLYSQALVYMEAIHRNSLHIYHERVSEETIADLKKLSRK